MIQCAWEGGRAGGGAGACALANPLTRRARAARALRALARQSIPALRAAPRAPKYLGHVAARQKMIPPNGTRAKTERHSARGQGQCPPMQQCNLIGSLWLHSSGCPRGAAARAGAAGTLCGQHTVPGARPSVGSGTALNRLLSVSRRPCSRRARHLGR